jgi:formate-nitrite transporter family protein
MAICAIIITVALLQRPVGPPPPPPEPPVEDFATYHDAGQRIGPATAPVTIVEFSDFQCPSCRQLHTVLRELRARFPDEVSVLYRHYPIESIHAHAVSAAIASECAAAQGRFEAFHDLLYEEQSLLGMTPYSQFAAKAGVADTAAFTTCLSDPAVLARLAEDKADAVRLGVRGTPTVLVNSQKFTGGRSADWIAQLVRAELESKGR